MLRFVTGDVGETVSDPGWETGLGKSSLVELTEAGEKISKRIMEWLEENLQMAVEVVLEVLKGQSVLENVSVGDSTLGHGGGIGGGGGEGNGSSGELHFVG